MIGDIRPNRLEIMCYAYKVFKKAVIYNRKKNGSKSNDFNKNVKVNLNEKEMV